ncbi:CopM family metallochaperone [Rhizobium leguminosarum]|uniref:CopM family metallochaperone n=1 Tax=Rhizobium leguminosarum TaxID=384 RepID=UPI003F97D1AF
MNVFVKTSLAAVGATALLSLVPLAASAQEMTYPEKCKTAGMDMSKMGMSMDGDMKMGDMPMGDYQKASMEGMKSMHGNMMQGMMQKDADVAFVCGMIAHHMGAISMSEAELKYGDNKEAMAMARKVIDAQKKEIAQMTKWVNQEAK